MLISLPASRPNRSPLYPVVTVYKKTRAAPPLRSRVQRHFLIPCEQRGNLPSIVLAVTAT